MTDILLRKRITAAGDYNRGRTAAKKKEWLLVETITQESCSYLRKKAAEQ
jgi:hypothetical protein